MRFFVTGATGFVGSELVRLLSAEGHRVVALHRPGANLKALAGVEVDLRQGDVLDLDSVCAALEGCDGVFHVAGNISWFWRDRQSVTRSNVEGTRTVVEAMRRTGVRRGVATSTVSAVGVTDDPGNPASEGTPHNWPRSFAYPHSKRRAEDIFLGARDLETIAVNPGTVLGPGDLRMGVGDLFRQVAGRKVPRLKRGGLSCCDVRDVARGHLLAFDKGRPGERYLLVGENVRFDDLVGRIASGLGVRPPRMGAGPLAIRLLYLATALWERLGFRPQAPASQVWCMCRYVYHSNAKAGRDLGYTSRPLSETLDDSIRWYREEGLLDV